MGALVRIGEFASPTGADDLHDAVSDAVDWVLNVWADLEIERHRYRAPPHLLHHDLVIAEVLSGYRRNVEAAGCALTPVHAAAALAGELVERIAQVRFVPDVRQQTENELRAAGCPVLDLGSYLGRPVAVEDWPFARYTPELRLPWVPGHSLRSEEPVMVPASLIANRWGQDTVICEITTTGTAAAANPDDAIDHAVRELIERDALRAAWLLGRSLTAAAPPGAWSAISEQDTELGWVTRFFSASTVVDPAAWLVISQHQSQPIFGVGAACSDDREAGLEHALAEAVQNRVLAWLTRDHPRPNAVRGFIDHLTYYCTPERLGEVDAGLCTPGNGHAGTDATATDAADPLEGAVVVPLLDHDAAYAVKVFAPVLLPMEADHRAARLVGRAAHLPAEQLNRRPHPFG